nr:hypothetical protein Iba_scaffold156.2CG0060 [Ipomoea batatas]
MASKIIVFSKNKAGATTSSASPLCHLQGIGRAGTYNSLSELDSGNYEGCNTSNSADDDLPGDLHRSGGGGFRCNSCSRNYVGHGVDSWCQFIFIIAFEAVAVIIGVVICGDY